MTETTMRRPAASDDPAAACPIAPVVDIVFSRWTTPILWCLHRFGRQRFVELHRRIPAVTPKVLTQRLRQLERDGLLVRTYHPEVPPRVEYEISDLGRSLAPLFADLAHWAADNLGRVEDARRAYDAGEHRPARRG
ncbi:winged helix-turn-helix transcriptional regulator [Streptomonospora nanhaiensis]|uniref:DNA-binding HxlR family transcriptional regulator n=1 Tax=Streptomonospora nanhaiensis TaxID=1323731 RepID=A0A853BHM4_9ACTN|nr:helix-turn-helix domain-containing protein [Streptomonospora nanhaiensis]NYI94224.1 DNA-binding HxlR family transcriptional regulator [Streptomonospora nanhaiensis]